MRGTQEYTPRDALSYGGHVNAGASASCHRRRGTGAPVKGLPLRSTPVDRGEDAVEPLRDESERRVVEEVLREPPAEAAEPDGHTAATI
jgi:hypothetical protein